MLYLRSFSVPTPLQEELFLNDIRRTCYNSAYPFSVFTERELHPFLFEPITIFAGGNGSGKSTLLNVIARALDIPHEVPFNSSPMFEQYVRLCSADVSPRFSGECKQNSRIIASDNVFDYLLNVRFLNQGIDTRREELFDEYLQAKYSDFQFRGMGDYEDLRKVNKARRMTQSAYVRDSLINNIRERSNGENALSLFVQTIGENGLFLLDEPENSLSAEKQLELRSFLSDSARFFGCQLIISTHSPFLLSLPGAKIYHLDETPPKVRPWTEIPNVQAAFRFFMEHRDAFSENSGD